MLRFEPVHTASEPCCSTQRLGFLTYFRFQRKHEKYGKADIPNRVLFEKSLSNPTAEDLSNNLAKYVDSSIERKTTVPSK